MTFQEIFSSNFIDSVNAVSVVDMSLALALAFADGLFIFSYIRRLFSGDVFRQFRYIADSYDHDNCAGDTGHQQQCGPFAGNGGRAVHSRFRTAVKDPMDIVFLFWSIAAGIVLAAGLLLLAVAGSIFIGIVLLIFSEKKTFDRPYILVIHCVDSDSEERSLKLVEEMAGKVSLKSKTVTPGSIELNYEVRLRDGNTDFVNRLAEMDGVTSTVMVSYNGDYMG